MPSHTTCNDSRSLWSVGRFSHRFLVWFLGGLWDRGGWTGRAVPNPRRRAGLPSAHTSLRISRRRPALTDLWTQRDLRDLKESGWWKNSSRERGGADRHYLLTLCTWKEGHIVTCSRSPEYDHVKDGKSVSVRTILVVVARLLCFVRRNG
jgi:hypothetical protein